MSKYPEIDVHEITMRRTNLWSERVFRPNQIYILNNVSVSVSNIGQEVRETWESCVHRYKT